MAVRPAFGRRVSIAPPGRADVLRPARPVQIAPATANDIDEDPLSASPAALQPPSIDDELREWKRGRVRAFSIPWKQLSFMAAACFGIAGFVLPDSINDAVQWILYALAAASFLAGVKARRLKRQQPVMRPVSG